MKILGLTGPIGHGKSAFIEALHRVEPGSQSSESSIVISEVANFFNAELKKHIGKDAQLPLGHHEPLIGTLVNETMQAGLQQSTAIVFEPSALAFSPDDVAANPALYEKLWKYLDLIAQYPALLDVGIVPDNKAEYRSLLQWIGGYVTIKLGRSLWYEEIVKRGQAAGENSCKLYVIGGLRFPLDGEAIHAAGGFNIEIIRDGIGESESSDPTERERRMILIDSRVYNDGTLEQLDKLAAALRDDLMIGRPKPEYKAQAF